MMNKLQGLPEKLLVGLSGGADSVALLLLLLDSGAQVSAVHVNHGLRGDASDGDEAFVRALCAQHGVPLHTYRLSPPEDPGEGWARKERYACFRQAMAASGAEALALAHHRDDQAETLLLHLLRGAGLDGLSGMAPDMVMDDMRIVRPLLTCSRAELRAYLAAREQTWREDASNADPRYLRNAVRSELLPVMERLAPGAAQRLAATCRMLSEDGAALNGLAAEFLRAHPGDALPLDALRKQLPGMQKRILRMWWASSAPPAEERSLSAAQTEAFQVLVDGPASARCNLPGGWHGQAGWTHLHLVAPDAVEVIPEMAASDSPLLTVEAYEGVPGDGQSSQVIPRSWLAECTVRSRRRGDSIRPFGAAGRQTLQDYLVNRRIDAAFRDRVPLLCRGSEVLLVGGVGAGGIPRVNEIDDPVVVRWRMQFPWMHSRKNKEDL